MKRSDTPWPSNTSTFKSMIHILTIEHSVFSVMVGLLIEMLLMLFSIYNPVQ